MRPRSDRRIALVVLLGAAAGALLLVVQWLWGRVLWLDEEMIAINLRDRSMRALAGTLSLGQAAPYGWLVLQHAMLLAAGTGERALRLIPLVFGVATLATAAGVGRRWMTAAGALSLVFLCAMGQWLSFHALELKHYSADACFGLLLPALAAWAAEDDAEGVNRGRRVLVWWIVAAAAQWISNGALFVTPACALVLVLFTAKRFGWQASLRAAAPGCLWLASFALNYRVTLGPALGNTFLREYWANAFPPAAAGPAETLGWLANQLTRLAVKPGGSGFGFAFWGVSAVGLLAAPGYPLVFRALFASVPCSAFAWAALRLVPLSDRLGLWFVPALYVGIAMAVETSVALIRPGAQRGLRWIGLAAGAGGLAALLAMAADTYSRGKTYVALRPYTSNHDLDDRGAINWLLRQRRGGDVWLASYLSLPAIWWYAGPGASTPAVEASFEAGSSNCGSSEVGAWANSGGARRVLVYLGFGHDTPREFDEALLDRLSSVGHVTAYRPFHSGHALIVDFTEPSAGPVTLASLAPRAGGSGYAPAFAPDAPAAKPGPGCITVAPARGW
jgi:hypothetical protein